MRQDPRTSVVIEHGTDAVVVILSRSAGRLVSDASLVEFTRPSRELRPACASSVRPRGQARGSRPVITVARVPNAGVTPALTRLREPASLHRSLLAAPGCGRGV